MKRFARVNRRGGLSGTRSRTSWVRKQSKGAISRQRGPLSGAPDLAFASRHGTSCSALAGPGTGPALRALTRCAGTRLGGRLGSNLTGCDDLELSYALAPPELGGLGGRRMAAVV